MWDILTRKSGAKEIPILRMECQYSPNPMAHLITFVVLTVSWLTYTSTLKLDCAAVLSNVQPGSAQGIFHCNTGRGKCPRGPLYCGYHHYAVTCSCALNCVLYGDCCLGANLTETTSSTASCVRINIGGLYERDVYMISKCHANWPDDINRYGCERALTYGEAFYSIPVTSERMVTYRNGFCALCNYDLNDTAIYWNSSGLYEDTFHVYIPDIVKMNGNLFLRPCSPNVVTVQTCPEGSKAQVARKCSTYFAPVSYNTSSLVFKNAFCAVCNGARISQLACAPASVVPEIQHRFHFDYTRPNLLTLIRPVVRNDFCFSSYQGRCYIKSAQYHYVQNLISTESSAVVNSTASPSYTKRSYSIQNYFTITCASLSIICLSLKAAIYATRETARTFSAKCVLCLSTTLLCSHSLFLVANSFRAPRSVCYMFAITLHYGFLSTFVWTSVLSFDIWKNVVTIRHASARKGDFLWYCATSWASPFPVVALGATLDSLASEFALAPRYGLYSCWISSIWGQVSLFLVPVLLLLLLDVVLYVHIVIYIRKTSQQTGGFDFKSRGERSNMAFFVRLAMIMGITWLIGFVAAFFNVTAVDILVIVLIGAQGVYLFVAFKDYVHLLPDCAAKTSRTEVANDG